MSILVNGGDNGHQIGENAKEVVFGWKIPDAPEAEMTVFADQNVAVAVINANPANIVDGLHAAPGQSTVTTLTIPAGTDATLYLGSPVAEGSFQVAAQLDSIGQWTSDVQQVTAPEFVGDPSFDIGRGLVARTQVYAYYSSAGGCVNTATVESSDTSKVSVDNVENSNCVISFDVHGVALTDAGQPVNIRIEDAVHGFTPYTLPVTVSLPRIAFYELEGVRNIGTAKNFLIGWGPGSVTDIESGLTVHLEAVDEVPAGVLPNPAIVDLSESQNDGNFLIPKGESIASPRLLGATALGSYRISATLDNTQIGLSDTQVVATAVAKFDTHERPVGDYISGVYPIGHHLAQSVTVTLFRDYGELFVAPSDIHLHVQSRAEGFVHVQASPITVAAGQSTADFVLEGVELTDEPIQIDVYIEKDGESDPAPAGSLLVNVIQPRLVFNMQAARALNGPPSDITAAWVVEYPCENDGWSTCLRDYPPPAPLGQQTLSLSIVPD
jgi:hypothetical protein